MLRLSLTNLDNSTFVALSCIKSRSSMSRPCSMNHSRIIPFKYSFILSIQCAFLFSFLLSLILVEMKGLRCFSGIGQFLGLAVSLAVVTIAQRRWVPEPPFPYSASNIISSHDSSRSLLSFLVRSCFAWIFSSSNLNYLYHLMAWWPSLLLLSSYLILCSAIP